MIVQEYFQERVKIWLSTIGSKVFHIKYYWLRFEFAPSRGQIHAHILAIHENPQIMEPYYSNKGNKTKQEEVLHKWMTEDLGMTAWIPDFALIDKIDTKSHPSKFSYQDNIDQKENDLFCCLQTLQYHKCSAFCMRKCSIL